MVLHDELKKVIKGEVEADQATLEKYSHDASVLEIIPRVVVFPKDEEDVKALVKFASEHEDVALTARSGGTDMTGGSIGESIIMDFTRHMHDIGEVSGDSITSEPGAYYRDFEKKTLAKGMLMPSYPASREICAIGGMVNNDAGGEKTLKYGKTHNYVTGMRAVLADGNAYDLRTLTKAELDAKMMEKTFEGEVYKKVFALLDGNYDLAKSARPDVSKNSMGYNIWDVWDREKGAFDLVKLFVGSQGTLGITTTATLRVVKEKKESGLLVVFLKDLQRVSELVNKVLPLNPVSIESFDDNTFKLAVKFFWGFVKQFGRNLLYLAWSFLPEFWMVLTGGVPKLVVMIEFEGENEKEVQAQITKAREALGDFKARTVEAPNKKKSRKYWLMRRESFNLLRKRVKGMKTAPFIDDIVVKPEYLPEFLPKLYTILKKYDLLYTTAGHVGNGNFHIIPLMKLQLEEERKKIPAALEEVNALVLEYKGSLSAEHNEGLIRGPYSKQQFGEEVYALFQDIKKIFDPKNIFNPGKKVNADLSYTLEHIKKK